ncbi:hypothetical protein [Bacillus sp. 03113]|uniref:hypothetical protein n=1 Tax=Bacillus sp. 03113 TaxID=2578211 RepID=UPI00114413CD|nr:hypothetical protein [Bacillus sp. 03113]
MNDYLIQTNFAAHNLIDLINSEENALNSLKTKLVDLKKHHEFLYADFIRKELDLNDHFNDHQIMHSYAKQASFYNEHIEPLQIQIDKLSNSISSKQESIKALSGALLQIAKQGISIVHSSLNTCPDGRFIYNEPIKNIIWQGRNQSLHYEEGNFRSPIVRCFQSIGISLINKNLAKEIIDLLEWNTYQKYQDDMILLLG